MVDAEGIAPLLLQGSSMGAGFAGSFFILRWAAQFITGRMDRREERLDTSTTKLIDGLEKRVDDLTERLIAAEKAVAECKEQHLASEFERNRLSALLQGYGDARQQAALIVAAEKKAEGSR